MSQRIGSWTIGAGRDFSAEQVASLEYEQLRKLNQAELEQHAGFKAPRQQLIAHIMNRKGDA